MQKHRNILVGRLSPRYRGLSTSSLPPMHREVRSTYEKGEAAAASGPTPAERGIVGWASPDGATFEEFIERDIAAEPDLLLVLGISFRVYGPKILAQSLRKRFAVPVGVSSLLHNQSSQRARCAGSSIIRSSASAIHGLGTCKKI